MIICPPDCPDRKIGCHGQCEKYEERLADYRKRQDYLAGDRSVVGQVSDHLHRRDTIYAKRKKKQQTSGRKLSY
jgi:hypothetical protein